MYQEPRPAVLSHNSRVVAHATLDTELNILDYTPELLQWSCMEPQPLASCSLFELFPQLEPDYDIIVERRFPGPAYIYHNAYFAQDSHPDHVFDLQIEFIPGLPNRLLLTVIPLVSHLLVTAHEKDQNLAALARHNRELLLLNRASQILTATLDPEEVLERLLTGTAQITNAAGCSVWLWADDNQEQLVCRAAFHSGLEDYLVGARLSSGQGIAGWVAETNQGTIVFNPAADNRFYPHIDAASGFTTHSILAVPIHLRNRILGVLEVVNKRDGRFLSEDLSYAEMLAASAAIAIDNAQLIKTLQQKMTDLKIQNAELEAFDHTVAHDLQNPLALVVGFADLLKSNDLNISEEERAHALDLVVENAHRMSSIIQEMLMLSSVRKSEVETHPLDMQEIVLHAIDRLRFVIQRHNSRLILPDSWAVARGYAPWVEEVWENYISNALKYGGRPPQIELGSVKLADDRVKFWIRDNGEGIPREKQAMLFTPFTQLNEGRATGHGLGLSIVCRIMEKLEGEVGIESQPGKGSTFSFTLPAYRHPDE